MSTLNITERPILFSGPMVRAILEGRKTVTRRIAKPVKHPDLGNIHTPGALVLESEPQHVIDRACPYGQPGDRLWVRETWTIDMLGAHSTVNGYDSLYALRYRADDADREIHVAPGEPDPYLKLYDNRRGDWRPSIHMPRWACRILLEITAVRIERLQDISEEQWLRACCRANTALARLVQVSKQSHAGTAGSRGVSTLVWRWYVAAEVATAGTAAPPRAVSGCCGIRSTASAAGQKTHGYGSSSLSESANDPHLLPHHPPKSGCVPMLPMQGAGESQCQ